MAFGHSKAVRVQDDPECANPPIDNGDGVFKREEKVDEAESVELRSMKDSKEIDRNGKSLNRKAILRVFSENYGRVKERILDPHGLVLNRWNRSFLIACLVSLFVDPMFFYMPIVHGSLCVATETSVAVILTISRSITDFFYILQIIVKFHTAYVAPSSRVFGRGELVIDSGKIAVKYLHSDFWIDFIVALPLPQVFIWTVLPILGDLAAVNIRRIVLFIIAFQYLPRVLITFPLSSKIVHATGVKTKTAWAGAAYNFALYMLASHIVGACYYILSMDRQEACFRGVCNTEAPICQHDFFDCHKVNHPDRTAWFQVTNISNLCSPTDGSYLYGIYAGLVSYNVTNSAFLNKFVYCLWWGLQNLSTVGQNLFTTTYVGEIYFSMFIGILGLILFTSLIVNMQTYFQSLSVRLEEWRIKKADTEQWMHHRQLPHEQRESVRTYGQFKWVATRGVNEEALLQDLPLNLRKQIKRHLCYDLVRRVPLFEQMDERMLDAICERLKPRLCIKGTCLVREGGHVNEMLFTIRGNLNSYTTNGGRSGFFNSCCIGSGDFCGEELLTWALDPQPSYVLPLSTRTVKAISEVEAFALTAEDLKFVAAQYRRLHSKQIRHKFRFHSHQWRTWGACYIQAVWRRYKNRKLTGQLTDKDNNAAKATLSEFALNGDNADKNAPSPRSGFSMYDAILEATVKRGLNLSHVAPSSDSVSSLQKPQEPDFSVG